VEWKDDAKAKDYFAPLPLTRELNALRWDKMMDFWQRVLTETLRSQNALSFTLEELRSSLRREGCSPSCLEAVLAELLRVGQVKDENQLKAASEAGGSSWGSWLWGNLVSRPLSWGLTLATNNEEAVLDPKARLVHVPLLQARAEALLSRASEEAVFIMDHLVTQRRLMELANLRSSDDLQLLLAHLINTGKAAVFETSNGEKAAKLAKAGENKVVLNQADKGIMQLKETLASLEKQEAQLTKDIDRFKQKAVEWLRQKNKPKATMELKRKQRLQAALDKRLSFIENIQQILHTIDQTQTDKEVLEQYKLGVYTLKRVREESGVTVEAVDQVMDDLQEALLDQKEIDNAIAAGPQLDAVDEAELEEELAQLAAASNDELSTKRKLEGTDRCPQQKICASELLDALPSVEGLPEPQDQPERPRPERLIADMQ